MALPTIVLAEHLTDVLPADWSVIQGPLSSLEAKVVVLRSDTPWIQPAAFCHDLQRYAAVAACSASSPPDAERDLHELILELMNNLTEGWRFVEASGMLLDKSTGTELLCSRIKLEYTNSEQESS